MFKRKILPILLTLIAFSLLQTVYNQDATVYQCGCQDNALIKSSNYTCNCADKVNKDELNQLLINKENLDKVNTKVDNLFTQLTIMNENSQNEGSHYEEVTKDYIESSKNASLQSDIIKEDKVRIGLPENCDMDCIKQCALSDQAWDTCFARCQCDTEFTLQYETSETIPPTFEYQKYVQGDRFGQNFRLQGIGRAYEVQRGMKLRFTGEPVQQKCCEEYLPRHNHTDPVPCKQCTNTTIYVDKPCPTCPAKENCTQRVQNITCPTCETCKTCPDEKVCEKCKDCPADKICPECEACQKCKDCPAEKICPDPIACEKCKECAPEKVCEACKDCQSCPDPVTCPQEKVCEQCKNCTECPAEKVCDKCPDQTICEKCPEQVICEKPAPCKDCVCNCTVCKECPECEQCQACNKCADCPTCQNCTACEQCQTCPTIQPCNCTQTPEKNCTIVAPSNCTECQKCQECEACQKCETCKTCLDCPECQNCTACEECKSCPVVEPCNCPKIPEQNCTVCEKCQTCPECIPTNNTVIEKVYLPCNLTCNQSQTCTNTTIYQNSTCEVCKKCEQQNITCPNCPPKVICPPQKDCPITTCPAEKPCISNITCPSCVYNNYTTVVVEQRIIYRVITSAMAQFIIKTTTPISCSLTKIYDIIKELYFEKSGHITVTFKEQNFTYFIQVNKVSGFDTLYETIFIVNGIKSTHYVVIDSTNHVYTVAILNPNDFSVIDVNQVTLIWDYTTLTGARYNVQQSITTITITKIVNVIVQRFQTIIKIQRNLISAAQTGAMQTYIETNQTIAITTWSVNIIEFNQQVSTFSVTGYNDNGLVIKYNVSVDEDDEQRNLFIVKILQSSRQIQYTHTVIVYGVVNQPSQYYNVIIEGKNIVAKFLTTITFKVDHWDVYYSNFDVVIPEITSIIKITNDIQSTKIIYIQSNAAVSSLVRWVLELQAGDVELTTIQDSSYQTHTTITTLNSTHGQGPWSVTTRLIQYTGTSSLYYCKLTYPSGSIVGYFVLVIQTGPFSFETSVLFEGTTILKSYVIQLKQVSTTNVFRIVSITYIDHIVHLHAFNELDDGDVITDLSISTNITTSKNLTNATYSGSIKLSNKTTVEITTINSYFTIYQHPVTGKNIQLYENSTVIDVSSKKILSLNGGLTWVLQYFSEDVTLISEFDYKIFTYNQTGEKWRIYNNGSVNVHPTNQFVVNGGLNGLLALITKRNVEKFTTQIEYTVYKVEGTNYKFRVYTNNTVITDAGLFITNNGLSGLLQYLRREIFVYSTIYAPYQIAIDKSTSNLYLIYADGRVTTVEGTLITSNGASGLLKHLLSKILSIQFTTTVTSPSYQTLIWNTEKFYLYPNQTVINANDKTFITNKGIIGLQEWILTRITTITQVRITYQIVTDIRTGQRYYVYENSTVTTDSGKAICLLRGIECLLEHLYSQQHKHIEAITTTKIVTYAVQVQYLVYKDKQGNEYWISSQGRVYNPKTRLSTMTFNTEDFVRNLTFVKNFTTNQTFVQHIVECKSTKNIYTVYNDSSVFNSEGKFIVAGGFSGLIKFLTVQSLASFELLKEQKRIRVTPLNRDWTYEDFQFKENNGSLFCKSSSQQEAFDCFTAYLSVNYITRILAFASTVDFSLYIDGYDNEYVVYGNGLVTDGDSDEILDTGVVGLFNYLDQIYQREVNNVTILIQNKTTGIVQTRYSIYINEDDKKEYLLFQNSSLFDTKAKKFLTQIEYDEIIEKLTFTKVVVVNETVTYENIRVQGIDEESFDYSNYQIRSDGSSWYRNTLFQTFGGYEGLRKFLTIKKNMRVKYDNLEVFVPQINEKFLYQQDPERFLNSNGAEICRGETWKDIYACLTRYLANNYYEKFTYVKLEGNFTAFTLKDGTQYVIYTNGTVTTGKGIYVTSGGMNGFIDYYYNNQKEVYQIDTKYENITEVIQVYTHKNNKNQLYYHFDNQTAFNVTSKTWINNSFGHIANGTFVIKEFRNSTSLQQVTYYRDRLTNQTYKLLNDGKVYDLNNLIVTSKGYAGIRGWIQIDKNIVGNHYKNATGGSIIFETLDNLTYDVIQTSNYYTLVERLESRLAVLPRQNIQEVYNLVQDDLLSSKYYQTTHTVVENYRVVYDSNGKGYMILSIGIVVTLDDKHDYICTGGEECLILYLQQKLISMSENKGEGFTVYWATNGQRYMIDSNQGVYTYPEKLVIGPYGSGLQYLIDYLNGALSLTEIKISYTLYKFNNVDYYVYSNGRVTYSNDTEICAKGGLECLKAFLSQVTTVKSNSTAYSLYFFNSERNNLYRVYLSGSVTYDTNNSYICTTGGLPCLIDWYLSRQRVEQYSIVRLSDGRVFYITESGRVTSAGDNKEICATGGMPCLRLYIESTTPTTVSANGIIFYVFKNGTVFFIDGTVLCLSGGKNCINKYLQDQSFTIFTYNELEFKIYGNGKVVSSTGEVICQTGGSTCLNSYLLTLRYQVVTSGHLTFRFFLANQTVIQEDPWKVICVTGGLACLKEYLQPNYSLAQFAGVTYRIFNTGRVETDEGVLICATGGQTCLTQYIKSITPQEVAYTMNGQKYLFLVFTNGTVMFSNKTIIAEKGGVNALKAWIVEQTPQIIPFSIVNKKYQVKAYADGRMIDADDGYVYCKTGGVKCLEEWIRVNNPSVLVFQGVTYYQYINGTVVDANFKMICKTGGQQCLTDYLATFTPTVTTVTMDGINYNFNVFKNGTVIYVKTNEVVTTTGGSAAIEKWLLDRTPQTISVKVGTQTLNFKLYQSGKVEDMTGKVICQTGGQTCLTTYIENQFPTVMTYTINGTPYLFDMYKNGTVVEKATNKVICQAGSKKTCLDEYANNLMKAKPTPAKPTLIWLSQEQVNSIFEMVSLGTWIVSILTVIVISIAFSMYLRQYQMRQSQKIDRQEIQEINESLKENLLEKRADVFV